LDIYTHYLNTDYLISSTGQTSATGLSRLYEGAISHDQVRRLLTKSYLDSKDVWLKSKPLIGAAEQGKAMDDFAVRIIDDSILEKPHTDQNAMISTYYDHSEQGYVNGLNFVSLPYELNALCWPIAVTWMEKTISEWDIKTNKYKTRSEFTKNEYLRQMLPIAPQQVTYRYLLADSCGSPPAYSSAENMTFVLGLDHHFIFALESSRTIAVNEQDRKQGQFKSTLAFPDEMP
jgi:hypothetical protein